MAVTQSVFGEIFSTEGKPDPGLALIQMELARALLKDRQYTLGREMLEDAIRSLDPRSMQSLMNEIYRGLADDLSTSMLRQPMFHSADKATYFEWGVKSAEEGFGGF